MDKIKLDSAKLLAQRGWHVFPVHSVRDGACTCSKADCTSSGKHPRTKRGFKDASTDLNQIERWWQSWPDANIGLSTGPSGLAVLDVDAKNGGFDSLKALLDQHGELPDTLVCETGGEGKHYYFIRPEGGLPSKNGVIASGIDFKCDGGYVIAPPSNHSSGKEYVWQDFIDPNQKEIAELPQWISDSIKGGGKTRKNSENKTSNIIHEGGRNDFLTSEAGRMRRRGKEEPEIYASLYEINKSKCDPPLADQEVQGIAQSIGRYEPPEPMKVAGSYEMGSGGTFWNKAKKNDDVERKRLANFEARIVSEIVEDDGLESSRRFELEAFLNGKTATFCVSETEFRGLKWVLRELGAKAIISPGFASEDHLRVAIQEFSENSKTRCVYAHIGWRTIGKDWVYLTNGCSIGSEGQKNEIEVQMGDTRLKHYSLPDVPKSNLLKSLIPSLFDFLAIGPKNITVPLLSAIFRAPLGEASPIDFSIFLVGPSGCYKSELTAIAQSFWGSVFNGKCLPGNWSSTANTLEAQAFSIKDGIFTIDDFAPSGTQTDIARLHRDADRIFRSQGNQAGRGRMRADGSIRPEKYPRGLIISSGEDVPKGHSVRARCLILENSKGDIDLEKLSLCQKQAEDGIFSSIMAAFVRWLASQMDELKKEMPKKKIELRKKAREAHCSHARTPDLMASLMLGWLTFLDFIEAEASTDPADRLELEKEGWEYCKQAAMAQGGHQASEDPALRFLELLESAFVNGRAHLVTLKEEGQPMNPTNWGWQSNSLGGSSFFEPRGEKVGWVDEKGDLFFDPDAVFAVVQKLARDQGSQIPVTQQTLWKRLDEKGRIKTKEQGRNTIRKLIQGNNKRVLNILLAPCNQKPDKSDNMSITTNEAAENGLQVSTFLPKNSGLPSKLDNKSGQKNCLN